MFCMRVIISDAGGVSVEVTDKATGDEYALVNSEYSVGAFVGRVRGECERILSDIAEKCFEPDIFESEEAKRIIQYEREKYGAEAEYLWEKFPRNAVFR